jgi:hypothetical protein
MKKIFYFEWMDFGDASVSTNLVPKIAAYTSDKLKELIKLDAADSKHPTPRYKVLVSAPLPIDKQSHVFCSGQRKKCSQSVNVLAIHLSRCVIYRQGHTITWISSKLGCIHCC